MAASPLDVFWDRFRKPASGERAGTIETPPTKRKLINTMPDESSGEKVARAREREASESKEMNTSKAPPAASEVDAAMVRRWEDEFDVLFKAAHERDSCKANQLVTSAGPAQKREDDLARAVENEGFDMRGPVGQLWARELKSTPELREQYANVGTKREDQARFRIAWAKTQLENCSKRKEKSESYSLVDSSIGVYHGLGAIIQAEGGRDDPTAVTAARNYARRCAMMGGKWMRYNSWTERNEFLYVKQQHVTTMQRLWQSFEVEQAAWIKSRAPETNLHEKKSEGHHMLPIIEEKNGKDKEQSKAEHSDATPSILEVDDEPVVQLDTPQPSPVKNEKRKGSTNVKKDMLHASPKPASSRRGKATKKSNTSEIARLKQAWSIASRCKNAYNKASMQATILVQDIETGDNWKWARQDSGPLPLLKQALEALQEHAKQFFFRHVLVTDDPQTLLQLPGASMAQVLSDLDRVQGIQKYCDAVTAAIARAQAMQAVMVEQT